DEGEFGEGLLWQELLVAETDKPFADLVGSKAEVGGSEFFVEAGVTHAGADEDAFPGACNDEDPSHAAARNLDWEAFLLTEDSMTGLMVGAAPKRRGGRNGHSLRAGAVMPFF